MWIYLLRHGTAQDAGPDLGDEERALTDEGQKRLRRAAPTWRRLVDPPDRVVVSPLRRARQTAEVFVEAVHFTGTLRIDNLLTPAATPGLAVGMLEAEQLAGTGSIALIGHEPHLGRVLGTLLTGQAGSSIPLKKGMLVGVETETTTNLVASLRFALSQRAAGKLA